MAREGHAAENPFAPRPRRRPTRGLRLERMNRARTVHLCMAREGREATGGDWSSQSLISASRQDSPPPSSTSPDRVLSDHPPRFDFPQGRGTGHGWPLFSAPWPEAAETSRVRPRPFTLFGCGDVTPVEQRSQPWAALRRPWSEGRDGVSALAVRSMLRVGTEAAANRFRFCPRRSDLGRNDRS